MKSDCRFTALGACFTASDTCWASFPAAVASLIMSGSLNPEWKKKGWEMLLMWTHQKLRNPVGTENNHVNYFALVFGFWLIICINNTYTVLERSHVSEGVKEHHMWSRIIIPVCTMPPMHE